jgi:ParB family chromosome partitioning protein
MYGILQPLTVTRKEIEREDGTFYTEYELIAGERRLRASKIAGLTQVPVIIREGEESEQEKLELAIIENLQREDLNAVDRALAFRQLADVFGLSHSQVAKKVGRSREYVSNSIRLLALPDYMLNSLKLAELSEGHARTLLMLNDRPEEQDVVFREILLKKLSVREVERIVRKIATDKVRKKEGNDFDTELIEIEKRFMETLGTRVQIQKTDYGGRLTIDYFAVEDLEAMLARMKADGIALGHHSASPDEQLAALALNTPLMTATEVSVEPTALQPEAGETLSELLDERRVEDVMSETDEALLTNEARNESVEMVPAAESPVADTVAAIVEEATLVTLPDTMPEAAIEEVKQQQTEESGSEGDVANSETSRVEDSKKEDDESDLYSIRHFSV